MEVHKNYVLYTDQWGYNVYISNEHETGSPATDIIDEAMVFSIQDDNQNIKLPYWKAVSGYQLKIKTVA